MAGASTGRFSSEWILDCTRCVFPKGTKSANSGSEALCSPQSLSLCPDLRSGLEQERLPEDMSGRASSEVWAYHMVWRLEVPPPAPEIESNRHIDMNLHAFLTFTYHLFLRKGSRITLAVAPSNKRELKVGCLFVWKAFGFHEEAIRSQRWCFNWAFPIQLGHSANPFQHHF